MEDGDIVVVTSKIVSKAEGRSVRASDREDAITSQTVRVVATRGNTRIVENPLGLVLAAAGVDSSNTPQGTVLILSEDPDASARKIRKALGKNVGVIISDTIERPWRQGVTDIAIGAAGIRVLEDLQGTPDGNGRVLEGTIIGPAEEMAGTVWLARSVVRLRQPLSPPIRDTMYLCQPARRRRNPTLAMPPCLNASTPPKQSSWRD